MPYLCLSWKDDAPSSDAVPLASWVDPAGVVPCLPMLLTRFVCMEHNSSQIENVNSKQTAYCVAYHL